MGCFGRACGKKLKFNGPTSSVQNSWTLDSRLTMPCGLANGRNFAKNMPVCCVGLKHLVVLERNSGGVTALKNPSAYLHLKTNPTPVQKTKHPDQNTTNIMNIKSWENFKLSQLVLSPCNYRETTQTFAAHWSMLTIYMSNFHSATCTLLIGFNQTNRNKERKQTYGSSF